MVQRRSYQASTSSCTAVTLAFIVALCWSSFLVSCFVTELPVSSPSLTAKIKSQITTATTTNNKKRLFPFHLAATKREDEIRRKISQLKRQGKIANKPSQPTPDGRKSTVSSTPVSEQYGNKVQQKLGKKKGRLLGITSTSEDNNEEIVDPIQAELDAEEEENEMEEEASTTIKKEARLGALPQQPSSATSAESSSSAYVPPSEDSTTTSTKKEYQNFNADLFDDEDDDVIGEEELSEEELVELVAAKLSEKRQQKREAEEAQRKENARKRIEELQQQQTSASTTSISGGKTTTGIGGTWTKKNETDVETYKPSKSGTWGVFDRPKDISTAFGGGKRVGAGYTPDSLTRKQSEQNTKDRLRQYREKVGIEVQSEKDHAEEIEQALAIGKRAMEVRTT